MLRFTNHAYGCSRWLSALGLLILLHGCASAPERGTARATVAAPRGDPARANDVLFRALGLVGTPYRYD
jgi:hypothetical protein